MIKLDLVNQIVERTGVSKTKAEQAVDTIFNCMKDALKGNDRIELRGFGVFSVKRRKTGIGRPRTGSEVSIPPGKAVRFKPGKHKDEPDATDDRALQFKPNSAMKKTELTDSR